jgi:membrane associated rhomboid family serine protease
MQETDALLAQTKDYVMQTQIIEQRNEILNRFVVVGASGSLFGLLLAFGMLFPNAELMLMFIPIPIKAKYFVAGYGLIELFSGISNNPNDNVAHFAHIGGMIFGFILLMIWRYRRIN